VDSHGQVVAATQPHTQPACAATRLGDDGVITSTNCEGPLLLLLVAAVQYCGTVQSRRREALVDSGKRRACVCVCVCVCVCACDSPWPGHGCSPAPVPRRGHTQVCFCAAFPRASCPPALPGLGPAAPRLLFSCLLLRPTGVLPSLDFAARGRFCALAHTLNMSPRDHPCVPAP
jgi:hypothetical protein